MARARVRRLKVFQAQFGFYDTVVATTSQAAALRAWGVHQDLFASGQAAVTHDAEAIKAALANPEVPLRRAVGSLDPFVLEPSGLPKAPDIPGRKAAKARARAERPARPPPDRRTLTAAEAALRDLDELCKRKEAEFRRQQEQLDAAREAWRADYLARRMAATTAVVEARQTYRKAGGTDS